MYFIFYFIFLCMLFILFLFWLGFLDLQPPSTLNAWCVVCLTAILAMTVNVMQSIVVIRSSPLILSCAYALLLPTTRGADLILHGTGWQSGFQVAGDILVISGFVLLSGISEKAFRFCRNRITSIG